MPFDRTFIEQQKCRTVTMKNRTRQKNSVQMLSVSARCIDEQKDTTRTFNELYDVTKISDHRGVSPKTPFACATQRSPVAIVKIEEKLNLEDVYRREGGRRGARW